MKNACQNCGNQIEVSIFKGAGYCSDNCRKALYAQLEAKIKKTCQFEKCGGDADECGYCIPHCEYIRRLEQRMAETVEAEGSDE